MNSLVLLVVVVIVVDLAVFGALWFLAAYSKANPPLDAGPGRLQRSPKQNVAGSLVDRPAFRADPLRFDAGEEGIAWTAAREAVLELPKSVIFREEPGYLHVECATALFGFIDDVEIEIAPHSQEIHLRSASRVGRSDFDANRKRLARVREIYQARLEELRARR